MEKSLLIFIACALILNNSYSRHSPGYKGGESPAGNGGNESIDDRITYPCSVMLPATTTVPYTLTFTCDGTVKTSTEVATQSSALSYALNNWSAYGTWTRRAGVLQVKSNCQNCSIAYTLTSSLTDTCSVMLPATTTIPYTLTFTCDGTVKTSTEVATRSEALAYALDNWSAYGTWTRTGGILQVLSNCDNCSINYNLTSSLTDTCSVMLPSTTTVPYTLTFTCDGTVLTSTEIMTLQEAHAYFQTNWSSYGTWTHATGVLQVISDCDNCTLDYNLTSTLTNTCSIRLPSTTDVPYIVTFICDGITRKTNEVVKSSAALTYANNKWSSYGTWTLVNNVLEVISSCAECSLSYDSDLTITGNQLVLNTSLALDMPNLYGSSAYDISVKKSIVNNSALITNIKDLNLKYWSFGTGAPLNYLHYTNAIGDGYNPMSQDPEAIGKSFCGPNGVQDGLLCHTYGREFYNEFVQTYKQIGVSKITLGINIATPLFAYANNVINWSNIDIGDLIQEINYAIARLPSANDIYCFELGMELVTHSWSDLFANKVQPSGSSPNPNADQVVGKLLNHTNKTSAVSILDHLNNVAPNAFISIDCPLLDSDGIYPNWVQTLTSLPQVDFARQYYQFYSQYSASYEAGRERIAQNSAFFDYIKQPEFNNKKAFISQIEWKANTNVDNRVAQGLILNEFYMTMTRLSLEYGNKLAGLTHMNTKQLFNVDAGYKPRVPYYFMKQLGMFFTDTQQLITSDVTVPDIDENLIKLAIKVDDNYKIMVVNPTANTYDLDELVIDGFPVIEYTNYQLYAPNGDVYSTSYSSVTESNRLSFRPYSSSLIQFEYNNQSKESGASIKSIDEKNGLNIYPNPNNGNFVIDILLQSSAENMKEDANQAATIQVFNLLGQMVITETIPIVDGVLFKEMKLGSMVATGMYSVRVIFDDEIHQSQVIYQR